MKTEEITLEPYDSKRLANLCGQFDEHLRQIERRLSVEIRNRGNLFLLSGDNSCIETATKVIDSLYEETAEGTDLTPESVHLALQASEGDSSQDTTIKNQESPASTAPLIQTKCGIIKARGTNQLEYMQRITHYDINFGIGPAGTGKTYLAVASAVNALEKDQVRRILLVRPAVEAGEKLGFLPGDLAEKINPYLRPLYDALYEMLGFERVNKLLEKQVIEVAPLAYMRGRTLNNAFIILDESQNTTREQMKMFLTRIGFGSKAVITGDTTQVDLPKGVESGLKHASRVLKSVPGIGFTHFESRDVVRHSIVQKIVEAYDKEEANPPGISYARPHKESRSHSTPPPMKNSLETGTVHQ